MLYKLCPFNAPIQRLSASASEWTPIFGLLIIAFTRSSKPRFYPFIHYHYQPQSAFLLQHLLSALPRAASDFHLVIGGGGNWGGALNADQVLKQQISLCILQTTNTSDRTWSSHYYNGREPETTRLAVKPVQKKATSGAVFCATKRRAITN